ncbi:Multidrug resistance-associated protein 9 [Chamberlinius hualienensis]
MGSIKVAEQRVSPQNLAVLDEFFDLEREDEDLPPTVNGNMDLAHISADVDPVIRSTFDYNDDHENCIYYPNQGIKRYEPTLRSIFPSKVKESDKDVLPLDRVGFLSFVTYWWLSDILWPIYRKGSDAIVSYRIPILDSCRLTTQRLTYLWNEEIKSKGMDNASFANATAKFVRTRCTLSTVIFGSALGLGVITPVYFLAKLMEFLNTPNASLVDGILYVVYIFIIDSFRMFMISLAWALNIRSGLRLRSAILGILFNKMINLKSFGEKSVGELINIFANDGTRIFEYVVWGQLWIAGSIAVTVCMIYVFYLLGLPGFMSLGVLMMFYVLQLGLGKLMARYRMLSVKVTDKRVRQMTEVLNYIKMIKLYAWEKSFLDKIITLRNEERKYLEKMSIVHNIGYPLSMAVPIIAAIATFLTCFALGYELKSSVVFPVVGALILCRAALYFLPISAGRIAEFKASVVRAEAILKMEDFKPIESIPSDPNLALEIKNATFAWDAVKSGNSPVKAIRPSKRPPVKLRKLQLSNERSEATKYDGEETATLTEDVNKNGLLPVLMNINLSVPKQKLIGISGRVGSGKSSLINVILGQLNVLGGDVSVRGRCGYVSQQAWIINSTVLDNITFGETYHEKKFQEVVRCCGLTEDLENLPGGVETEIGERGVNLSGGQKQRISLARAVYSDRDIYLLDDPLSAVDYTVGAHIFQSCIKEALKTKTVLFVSHLTHYLDQCDYVVVLKDGRILEEGEPKQLKTRNGLYTELATTLETMQEEAEKISKPVAGIVNEIATAAVITKDKPVLDETEKNAGKRITTDEKMAKGGIERVTYVYYIQAAGGFCVAALIIFTVGLNNGVIGFSNWWLSQMIQDESFPVTNSIDNNITDMGNFTDGNYTYVNSTDGNFTENVNNQESMFTMDDTEILVYGCLLGAIFVTILIRAFVYVKGTLRASSRLHKHMLRKVIESPMLFFETVPIGRIINLFSKDQDEVDTQLSIVMESFLSLGWMIVISLLMVVLVYPWFLIPLVVFAGVFFIFTMVFQVSLRELKRVENVSRSPLFGHISAMVQGLSTIHAFQKENAFSKKFYKFQDENTVIQLQLQLATRWLAFRLDILVVVLIVSTALFVVFWKGVVPAALAGLALSYSAQMGGMLHFFVRNMAETQARFTNVERIVHTTKSLVKEGAEKVPKVSPAADWPSKGEVVFDNACMRYRPGLPLALKGISFKVSPGERIGIVGRTGSGKSSLAVTMFRLVELCEGRVLIDDVDISEIELSDLRGRLSLIPQDPVLFRGTVRYNLDTFEQYTDNEIWEALEKTGLRGKISLLEKQLNAPVVENGENFSVGERQLLCLTRALLRNSKIILLDEATASVDANTDALVQQILEESFSHCTILTIAHRIHTVLNYHRILIMSYGEILEYDSPSALRSNPNSFLSMLLKESRDKGDL